MAILDPMAILMDVIRMIPAIFFILFMVIIFFSFRVELHLDEMKRFTMELSDSITSSPLAADKSVFSMERLNEAERADPNRNIELYSRNCGFGYYMEVESLAGETGCSSDNDCRGFCSSACGIEDGSISLGISGNCNCNFEIGADFCECKKFDEWQDNYKWSYGYTPRGGGGTFATARSDFPVGISFGETALPAKLTLTAYDSFLTRISCITQKAYELKENFTMDFARSNLYPAASPTFRRTDPSGTHVCIYSQGPTGDERSVDCRYMPDVPFEELRILRELPGNVDEGKITAYPVKNVASCSEIRENPDVVAGKTDTVATVVLCVEPLR